jgi:hypothetical protein
MVGEARRNNMIGWGEAASLTDIPSISQKGIPTSHLPCIRCLIVEVTRLDET